MSKADNPVLKLLAKQEADVALKKIEDERRRIEAEIKNAPRIAKLRGLQQKLRSWLVEGGVGNIKIQSSVYTLFVVKTTGPARLTKTYTNMRGTAESNFDDVFSLEVEDEWGCSGLEKIVSSLENGTAIIQRWF